MATGHCRWYRDAEVPGGRYLVPGCWSRVIYGDYAECECDAGAEYKKRRVAQLLQELDELTGKRYRPGDPQ